MLRWIGTSLIGLGVVVGSAVGLAILGGVQLTGVSWVLAVGVAKLTLLASGGLMASGAICLRLDRRERKRSALARISHQLLSWRAARAIVLGE